MDHPENAEVLEQLSAMLCTVKTQEDLRQVLERVEQLKVNMRRPFLKPIFDALEIFNGLL